MDKKVRKWIDYARADLDAATRLFRSPGPTNWTYLLVLWHCQQTVEKALKMVLIKQGKDLVQIHDLSRLASLSQLKFNEEQLGLVDSLNKYYLRTRYPDIGYDPLPSLPKEEVEQFLVGTKELFSWIQKQ